MPKFHSPRPSKSVIFRRQIYHLAILASPHLEQKIVGWNPARVRILKIAVLLFATLCELLLDICGKINVKNIFSKINKRKSINEFVMFAMLNNIRDRLSQLKIDSGNASLLK
jgi:hypothetical protein